MKIRTRLTLQFLIIGGIIMISSAWAIYYFSSKNRKVEFYNQLINRATSTTNLLVEYNGLNAAEVRRIETNNPLRLNDEKIIILDYKDAIIYSTDDNGEIKIDYPLLEEIRSAKVVARRNRLTELVGILYYVNIDRYVVIAAATDVKGFRYIERLGFTLFFVVIFSLILIMIGGWFYAGRSLRPISDVIRQVENISITSLNLRVNEGNGKDEMAWLAKTFNGMLERLGISFAMQKDFIANASHELRTPLTAINGQLDVLLMKERTNEEYKTAISSVLDDTRSMIDLSNRLLMIAHTSAEGPLRFSKNVRVDEILWQAREELLKFNGSYRIQIRMDEQLPDESVMNVSGDENLLKVAVSNLMDNACKYSANHTVEVSLRHVDNKIMIEFADKGIGIPADEISKIFQPFYRASNTFGYRGSGIGLPLVRQIINNHNGILDIRSQAGEGTCVSVALPVCLA